MKRVYVTQKQINEMAWMSNSDMANGGGPNKVSLQGFTEGDYYDCGNPITTDEIGRSLTTDFFKEFGMSQGRNYKPSCMDDSILASIKDDEQEINHDEDDEEEDELDNDDEKKISEEYTREFLNKKFKPGDSVKAKMNPSVNNGFVTNYFKGDTTLKALRQKVYNMEHGRSSEDPETQKQIINAYNNAKKVNSTNQCAKKELSNVATSFKPAKDNAPKNEPIITYF